MASDDNNDNDDLFHQFSQLLVSLPPCILGECNNKASRELTNIVGASRIPQGIETWNLTPAEKKAVRSLIHRHCGQQLQYLTPQDELVIVEQLRHQSMVTMSSKS